DTLSRQPLPSGQTNTDLYALQTTCPWYNKKLREVRRHPQGHPDFQIRDRQLYRRFWNPADLSELGDHQLTPVYTSQANPVERVNRVLKPMLAIYCEQDQKEWDKYLPELTLTINSCRHDSTGYSTRIFKLRARAHAPDRNTLRPNERYPSARKPPNPWLPRAAIKTPGHSKTCP
ncbi:hypothetical protein CBL_21200, partial [Carabus blaptoides fortunei]